MNLLKRCYKFFVKGLPSGLPGEFKDWLKITVRQREMFQGLTLIEKAAEDRIGVLAPHPDDDVFGCGGTLCKHRMAGDHVTVIYLTDGARGDDYTGPPSPALAKRRRREAHAAAKVLGLEELVFLDHRDGELPVNQSTARQILKTLKQARVKAVFLPFLLDDHPDHRAANRLFALISQALDKDVMVYAYEVWTPLKPNRLVDITRVAAKKERAIEKHLSQLKHLDYGSAILGLNRFRSLPLASGQELCEAFWVMDAHAYGRLVNKILGGSPR